MEKYSSPAYEKTILASRDIITASNNGVVEKENDGVKVTYSISNIFR